jgi:hypothetical protein
LRLSAAFGAAALASMCMLQGAMAWLVMIVTLLLTPDWRGSLWAVAGLAAAFLFTAAFDLNSLPGGAKVAVDLLFTVKGLSMLAGTPFLGAIHAQFVPAADLAIGSFIVAVTLLNLAIYFNGFPPRCIGQSKYIGWILFGAAMALLITLGRHQYTLEQLASSRYATAMLPAATGIWGFVCLAALSNSAARASLVVLSIVTMIGVMVTNYQEARLVPARLQNGINMQNALRDGVILTDRVASAKKFYVNA